MIPEAAMFINHNGLKTKLNIGIVGAVTSLGAAVDLHSGKTFIRVFMAIINVVDAERSKIFLE